MKKYFGLSILTLLLVGLLSTSAFAAASPTLNAGNTTTAAELISSTVDLAIPNVYTAYEVGGAVAPTSQIKVSIGNGNWTAGTVVDMCDSNGTTVLSAPGTVAAAPANTYVVLTVGKQLTTGQVYNFQPTVCAAPGTNPLNNVINIGMGTLAGSNVTMTVDDNLNNGNANIYVSENIVRVLNQFSMVLTTAVTETINFSATPTMSNFKVAGGGTRTTSTAKAALISDETIARKINTTLASNAVCSTWVGSPAIITYTVTPTSGTTMNNPFIAATAYQSGIAGAYGVVDTTIASTDTSATGTIAPASACGTSTTSAQRTAAAVALDQVLTVTGTTAINPATYALAAQVKPAGTVLAAIRSIMSATLAWTWRLDSSQYYVPLIGSNASAGRETYIKLQAKNTTASAPGVSIAILANDGTVTATWTGTLTAGTPLTVSGADLAAAATAAGKTVDGSAGFAVIITVDAPRSDCFIFANMTESTGNTKVVPVQALHEGAAAVGSPYIME